jgi:hypothetical protein
VGALAIKETTEYGGFFDSIFTPRDYWKVGLCLPWFHFIFQ